MFQSPLKTPLDVSTLYRFTDGLLGAQKLMDSPFTRRYAVQGLALASVENRDAVGSG